MYGWRYAERKMNMKRREELVEKELKEGLTEKEKME
jgi:hypothetical protein